MDVSRQTSVVLTTSLQMSTEGRNSYVRDERTITVLENEVHKALKCGNIRKAASRTASLVEFQDPVLIGCLAYLHPSLTSPSLSQWSTHVLKNLSLFLSQKTISPLAKMTIDLWHLHS